MTFLTQFLNFFFLNSFVFLSSVLLALYLNNYRIREWSKILITVSVIFYALITFTSVLLGMFKMLFFWPQMFLHAGLLILLLSTIGRTVIREWHQLDQSEAVKPIDWFLFAAIFTPFLILAFTRFFNALYQVPIEYDNLAYHLPFMVDWLQNGDLWKVYYSAFAGPLGYYPSNFELLDLWIALPFHGDLMINLINIPIFVLLPIVLYKVARNFGITNHGSLLVVMLFLMMPVTMRQLGVPLVDIYFCLTFLWGLFYLQEYRKTGHLNEVWLAGLALGLFAGTKYLGIVYIVPLVIIFMLFLFFHSKQRLRSLWWGSVIFLSAMFLTGSFWYLRNWVDTGNPLFPTDVSVGGYSIFQGYLGITDNLIQTSLASNIPSGYSYDYVVDRFVVMVGGQFFLFLACFVLLLLVIVVKGILGGVLKDPELRKKAQIRLVAYLLVAVAIVIYLVGYWYSPYSFKDLIPNVRYAFMFLLLACIMVGIVISEIRFLRPFLYIAGFSMVLYTLIYLILFPPPSILTNERLALDFWQLREYWVYVIVFALLLAGIAAFFTFLRYAIRDRKLLIVCLLLGLNTGALSYILFFNTVQIREQIRSNLYYTWYNQNQEWLSLLKAADWFNDNAPNANIAYTGFNFHYPLFGRKLERKVDYINVNSCSECTYKDFKTSTTSIRSDAAYPAWESNLRKFHKEYVVVKKSHLTEPLELTWINAQPEVFKEVFHLNDVFIYKIVQ